MFYVMGAFFGYVLLTLLVRETVYAKNESPYAETYSGILVAIFGAGVNGFGNADGGVFNISMVYTTFLLYLGFVVLTLVYNWLRRTKYEFIPQSKLERYIYWPLSILLVAGTASLIWLTITTNERLFDYKEGYKLETMFGGFLLISPSKQHVITTFLAPMESRLPIQLDELTVLSQVEYDEAESLVLYQYVLVDSVLNKDQLDSHAARVLEASCSDETMTDYWLFKADISITHEYFDSKGYKAIIRLSPELCSHMIPYVALETLN
jgi:hypothetical protein